MNRNYFKVIIAIFLVSAILIFVIMGDKFSKLKNANSNRVEAAQLVVWTNSSFKDAYGPAHDLKEEFEKTCLCSVVFVDSGGTSLALEKLKLDPSRRVDVILGVDLLELSKIYNAIKIQELDRPNISWKKELEKFVYSRAIPYDWSPMGFVYRKNEIESFKDWDEFLARAPKQAISLQDPMMSAPGKMFLFWLYSIAEPDLMVPNLKRLKPLVHSYSSGWSASYGLFKTKQVPLTFTYLSSLIYHWQEEKDFSFQFLEFDSGHPVQIEYAVVPEACWNCNVAKKFVEFLTSPFAQKILANKNYMLPVDEKTFSELGPEYQKLPKLKFINPEMLNEFTKNEEQIFEQWRAYH